MASLTRERIADKEAAYCAHYDECLECRTHQSLNPTWPYSPLCTQGRDLWQSWQQVTDEDIEDCEPSPMGMIGADAAEVARLQDIIRRMDAGMLCPTCPHCEREDDCSYSMAADEWNALVAEAARSGEGR